MEGTRDTRNDGKTKFLIKPLIFLFLRSCYIANGQGEGELCQVCWNSGMETSLDTKEILRVCNC